MRLAIVLAALCSTVASAAPLGYPWLIGGDAHDALSKRFPPPAGFTRIDEDRSAFGGWLRGLPLEPVGTKVHLFDGKEKPRQDVHVAVVALDVGTRDLQQCADAVMRLRTEYLAARGQMVEFHPDPSKRAVVLRYDGRQPDPGRKRLQRFLVALFADAGSASLQAEMPLATGKAMPGDVLIQGGSPGHAILVLDAADDASGKRKLMLGQSYMPAQQFHVLKAPDGSAWYDEGALDGKRGLQTAEWWRPFHRKDVRRF